MDKVREYAAVASVRRYVIAEQSAPVLTVYHRHDAIAGLAHPTAWPGGDPGLAELGITLPVDEIYEDLTFPEDDVPAA